MINSKKLSIEQLKMIYNAINIKDIMDTINQNKVEFKCFCLAEAFNGKYEVLHKSDKNNLLYQLYVKVGA